MYFLHASIIFQLLFLLKMLPNCYIVVYRVVVCLALEQCRLFGLHLDFLAIINDWKSNVAKAFNNTLEWDWLHCGCLLIHNVIKVGLDTLRNNAINLAQAMPTLLQHVLDKLAVLPSHCIGA